MKTLPFKKLLAFIMVMFSFTFASAQTCNANKIRVYKCSPSGHCNSKCVNPNKIPAGWSPLGCAAGCGDGGGCNCNIRPIPFECGQICGFKISSPDNDKPFISFTASIVPNPVSNSATITFSLSQSQNVSLKIFDLNGRLVSSLADHAFEEGEHALEWNAAGVSAGVYFLRMQTSEILQMEKLIVTK